MPKQKIDHDEIKTLTDLWVAKARRQSVWIPNHHGFSWPRPAAFVLNLSGELILRFIEGGLRVYRRTPCPGNPWHERRKRKPGEDIPARMDGEKELPW